MSDDEIPIIHGKAELRAHDDKIRSEVHRFYLSRLRENDSMGEILRQSQSKPPSPCGQKFSDGTPHPASLWRDLEEVPGGDGLSYLCPAHCLICQSEGEQRKKVSIEGMEREPCGHFKSNLVGDDYGHFHCDACRSDEKLRGEIAELLAFIDSAGLKATDL